MCLKTGCYLEMYNLCTPLLSMYASFGIGSKIENLNIFNTFLIHIFQLVTKIVIIGKITKKENYC